MNNIELSIVIIGYNEAKNIRRSIEAIKNLKLENITYELIYVDSNSNDDSLKILRDYDYIKVYSILSNRYTAALARFIGSKNANGKYIMFLDADMEIKSDSNIEFCINLLQNNTVGIVSGKLPEKWYIKDTVIKAIEDRYNVNENIEELNNPGGYFLIRKEILDICGNFDIELSCNEEIDLFARLKQKKLKLIRTKKLSCIHHNYISEESKNGLVRFKNKYYSYIWRVLRKSIKNQYVKEYLSFNTQLKTLRSIIITLIMIILLSMSIKNIYLLLIPIAYYITLSIKNKFNMVVLISNQFYNIIQIVSIMFLFSDDSIKYEVKNII